METIIQIQHLQKHFGNLKVLNDVDFDIHKGEVVYDYWIEWIW